MANESKKFALLCSCLMTMQALRLVISTAGFCAVRFHIDCSLFNIFISRLVNAVMMSSLLGNWLGDVIVFTASGHDKLKSAAVANWAELFCFCTALFSIMHTEVGHLTGFYWSMVSAYFWWKVGEAPATSIAPLDGSDYYFAGFTLSGVWAAMLKSLVMRCVTDDNKSLRFQSQPLGEVNVKIVGARSVKTTVDYRASVWLYIITIVLTALMCLAWSVIANAVEDWNENDTKAVVDAHKTKEWQTAIQGVEDVMFGLSGANKAQLGSATLGATGAGTGNFTVEVASVNKDGQPWGKTTMTTDLAQVYSGVGDNTTTASDATGKPTVSSKIGYRIKEQWEDLNGGGSIVFVTVAKKSQGNDGEITLTVKVDPSLGIKDSMQNMTVAVLVGIDFGGVLAVPGAMLGVGVGWVFALCFKCCVSAAAYVKLTKWCQLIFGIVGALGGMVAGVTPLVATSGSQDRELWVVFFKKDGAKEKAENAAKEEKGEQTAKDKAWRESMATSMAALIGLGAGLATGALLGIWIGLMVGAAKGQVKRRVLSGLAAGAFIGSFLGLISGEMANGAVSWPGASMPNQDEDKQDKRDKTVVFFGMLIVASGLGTVYSIYPGMSPCSITQFQYFNIIDILILILSAIAPLVIMGADLGKVKWRLAKTIAKSFRGDVAGGIWMAIGIVLLIATNVCEIIVLSIMQHPFSKMAQKVTTSGWRAVLLTVTMVTSQLVSTGVGFGCVAAGSGFNDGWMNVNSTLVLWTIECTGVLGEGYLTELKKYEPGKWPTQGLGGWASYKWWNGKAFGNAWQIWCCIGTTDLRRDIMLCRQ